MSNTLEKMADFFEARLDGYDTHMLNDIEGATAFYPLTAEHETEALIAGGFSAVEVLGRWGATYCLRAKK